MKMALSTVYSKTYYCTRSAFSASARQMAFLIQIFLHNFMSFLCGSFFIFKLNRPIYICHHFYFQKQKLPEFVAQQHVTPTIPQSFNQEHSLSTRQTYFLHLLYRTVCL